MSSNPDDQTKELYNLKWKSKVSKNQAILLAEEKSEKRIHSLLCWYKKLILKLERTQRLTVINDYLLLFLSYTTDNENYSQFVLI